MGRRTLLLIAAVLVAALGSALIFFYVQGVDQRAKEALDPVDVLVAQGEIAVGTTGGEALSQGLLRTEALPKTAVAEGAIGNAAAIQDLRAVSRIFKGEQILAAKFGSGATQSVPLAEGLIAVSVLLEDQARVASFVTPGVDVAVFATLENPAATEPGSPDPSKATNFTRLLLPRARVVAVGEQSLKPSTAEGQDGEAVSTQIVTLAVTQDEAERLIYAQSTGALYCALLTETSATASNPGATFGNLFG